MLRPCMSAGTFSPAMSMNVGAKSVLRIISSWTEPGLMTPGQRMMNGIFNDGSYMKRLSNRPWSPRKNPWSLV